MFYIFHGPDEFSANEQLSKLKSHFGDAATLDLNTTELEGKSLSLAELMHHASAIPFLAPHRVVIVNDYLSRLGGKERDKADTEALKKLADFLEAMPETTKLVFMESAELKKTHPILKIGLLIDKCVHLFKTPPKQQLPTWIEKRTQQKGGKIEPQATQALAEVVGDDLRWLDNEIEKLTLYVNNKRPITLADVTLLCPYTADSESFAMTNAIGKRNSQAALDQLHKRLEEGQHPLAIMAGIVTQFRGLLEVKSMAAAGLNPRQIANEKGWRSDYAAKMRLNEAKNFSQTRLVEIFTILRDTDLAIKTGQVEQTLALDMLISQLCGSNN